MAAIEKVIQIAKNEVGYLEKKSNSSLDDKTANAGSANYTKYWRDIKTDYQGQPWCAAFVTWCFVKAFGRETAEKLLKHYPYVYCPTMASLFTLHANPQPGDIVIFKRGGEFVHTGIVTWIGNADGDPFKTVEGNTSGGSSIVANGGGVFEKTYYNSNLPGTKFVRPDYSILESEEDEEMKEKIKELEKRIAALENPMIYDYIDDNMPEWAKSSVQKAIEKGVIKGVAQDENGNILRLGLTETDLKCIVREDRAGVYGE